MKRLSLAVGVAGLALALALPASAQKQIAIFGTTYNVTTESRAGAYKNGTEVSFAPIGNKHAYAYFEPGTDAASNRLWVVSRITGVDAEDGTMPTGTQMYVLEGTDANGCFTKAASNATAFFGNNVTRDVGRRPTQVILLNRNNTGVKVDRNLLAVTFFDDDGYRIYDLDTMTNGADDAVFSRVISGAVGDYTVQEPDPNLPIASFPVMAHLPTPDGKTILVVGGPAAEGGIAVGVWDTSTDNAFNVLTNLTEITANSPTPLPSTDSEGNNLVTHSISRISGTGAAGEYLLLLSAPDPGGDGTGAKTAVVAAQVRITVPDNLSSAAPGSIKAEVLNVQTDLLEKAKDILYSSEDASGAGGQGIISLVAGPEVTAGKRTLYATDFNGNISCLVPVP